MTRYARFELRVKVATNKEFQPCDVLKLEATSEMDSDTVPTLECLVDVSFDALTDTPALIPLDMIDTQSIIVFVDNTQGDYAIQLDVWDSSGTDVGEHFVDAGDWAKIPGYMEADSMYIKCRTAAVTNKVRVIVLGEVA